MTNDRKKWLCPSCPHRSSRKDNMKVHIQRWHKGIGQPLYIDHQAASLFKDKNDLYSKESSASVSNSVSSNLPFHKFSSKKPEEPFEFVNEIYRMVIEAKEMHRKVEEINGFFNDNFSHSTQLSTNNIALANSRKAIVPSISLPPFRANLSSSSPRFAPTINPQETKKEEIAGFKAKVCETCMEIVIETQYGVDESGKSPEVVTRNSHICSVSKGPSKPLTLESGARQDIDTLAKLAQLPWELKKAVKRWTGQDGQNNAYLVAFKLPIDKVKANIIIDIYTLPSRDKISNNLNNSNHYTNQDNNDKGTHEWALRAIENGQIILNDNDLLYFLKIANNRTSGYFRIHANNLEDREDIDNSDSSSEIYCMFINKGSVN